MNTETILKIARECGAGTLYGDVYALNGTAILAFASAIEEAARKDEREKCAQLIYMMDDMSHQPLVDSDCCKNAWMVGWEHGTIDCANKIRNQDKTDNPSPRDETQDFSDF